MKKEKQKIRTWDTETLKQYADKWVIEKGTYIKLLTTQEYDKVRKGSTLIDRHGITVKKGVDTPSEKDSVLIFGRMPYGLKLISGK